MRKKLLILRSWLRIWSSISTSQGASRGSGRRSKDLEKATRSQVICFSHPITSMGHRWLKFLKSPFHSLWCHRSINLTWSYQICTRIYRETSKGWCQRRIFSLQSWLTITIDSWSENWSHRTKQNGLTNIFSDWTWTTEDTFQKFSDKTDVDAIFASNQWESKTGIKLSILTLFLIK